MREHGHDEPQKRSRPSPATAPLRDSLRHLRDALHKGRDLAGEAIERSPLPPPVSGFARGMLSELDRVALRVEGLATEVARDLLGDEGPAVGEASRRFGETLAQAFEYALDRIGGAPASLDQEAVGRLHAGVSETEGDATRQAALLLEGVLAMAPAAARGEARVAAFGALLWLLSDGSRDRVALLACADLAVAIQDEIEAAAGDAEALARLFREFRDHV